MILKDNKSFIQSYLVSDEVNSRITSLLKTTILQINIMFKNIQYQFY